jgi:SAM-dependent methyltransferase
MYKINRNEIESISKCPTCYSDKTKKISEVIYKNKFPFFSTDYCEKCSLIFRSKRPKENWFLKNWNLRDNIQKAKSINFLNSKIETDRKNRYALILKKVITQNLKILDIGCGPGTGLKKYAIKNDVHGIEPDITRARVARKNNIKVFNCSLENFYKKNKQKYDLVIFFHTLEHMFKPKKTIKMIEHLLNKNGKLIIEVPNFLDWVSSWHDSLYLAHMQNFDLYSLNQLMIKNNFFPTEVFYTKYKNKEKNICAIYKKSSSKENIEKKLFENLKKELTYKKVKNIYNPGNHKVIKININEINDLSLTYKPAEKIHQNILDNILERKVKFNTSTKNYEVLGKKLKITRKTSSKNNYEKFLDNKCIKLNNFLKKINNGL